MLILNVAKATLNHCGKLSSLIFVLTNETPLFNVEVFNAKVPIVDTIFASFTEEETVTFTWSSQPLEGQTVCRAKTVPYFFQISVQGFTA